VDTGRGLVGRLLDFRASSIDVVLAILLSVGGIWQLIEYGGGHRGAGEIIATLVATGSVAWRHRNAAVSTVVGMAALVAFQLAGGPHAHTLFQPVSVLLDYYSFGRSSNGRIAMRSDVGVVVLGLIGMVLVAALQHALEPSTVATKWFVVALPFAAGRMLSNRQALVRELRDATTRLKLSQEFAARRSALDERTRIARELHDVIAHDVSVMVIQTGAAREVHAGDLEAARSALGAVERCGREALDELHRLIGVGIETKDDPTIMALGLTQLPALAARVRSAGLPVELKLETFLPALSPGRDLVAYRVAQEALTNVLKHAGPATAVVRVGIFDGALAMEITDNGRGCQPSDEETRPAGHGLLGMRERVALYSGEIHSGPRSTGGFEVRVRIPIGRADR
jgi:signal transduction histidine kinase